MNLFWRLVFWWKKRTGWIDLNETIEVTGTVIKISSPDLDGDRNFDVAVDPQFNKYITGFGGRLTHDPGTYHSSMHCEIPPWAPDDLKERFDRLAYGDKVKVTGRWGFDGVHVGVSEWQEVLLSLVRHQPNVKEGRFEIHPVQHVVKL